MGADYLLAWLRALLLTVVVEAPMVAALTRRSGVALARRLVLAVLAQIMTHPFLWFVVVTIPGLRHAQAVLLGEAWAWLGEALLYGAASLAPRWWRALLVAGAANACSYALGLALG